MDSIKIFLTILVLVTFSCNDEQSTRLIIEEAYGHDSWEKTGLIKGELFVPGFSEPLYSNLITSSDRQIVIDDLLEGTYLFEYYVKPYGKDYWPISRDIVFQIHEGETL